MDFFEDEKNLKKVRGNNKRLILSFDVLESSFVIDPFLKSTWFHRISSEIDPLFLPTQVDHF
jgi:hypothetical protein